MKSGVKALGLNLKEMVPRLFLETADKKFDSGRRNFYMSNVGLLVMAAIDAISDAQDGGHGKPRRVMAHLMKFLQG